MCAWLLVGCRRVEVLRWLALHGLPFEAINAHGQGCVNKAAWFGHAKAVHWLLCAEDGPKLGEQLTLADHENGLTVAELTHCAGHFALGCWLDVLAAGGLSCCAGTPLPPAVLGSDSDKQEEEEWLPWREERLLRIAFCLQTQRENAQREEQGSADKGCSTRHSIAADVAAAAAAAAAAGADLHCPLTPAARRWRKSLLLAAGAGAGTYSAAASTEQPSARREHIVANVVAAADGPAEDDGIRIPALRTPVARALLRSLSALPQQTLVAEALAILERA
jgi:hypothetical protein